MLLICVETNALRRPYRFLIDCSSFNAQPQAPACSVPARFLVPAPARLGVKRGIQKRYDLLGSGDLGPTHVLTDD